MGPPKIVGKKRYGQAEKPCPSECCFCQSSVENEVKLGKLMKKQGISIHYFCMLFASGLSQRGRTDKDGLLGFLPPDILKESRRSKRLKCTYCKEGSATIGCVRANCRACFHFGCGVDNGSLNQFFGNFSSFCGEHRPLQKVPENELKKYQSQYSTCVICMSKVPARPGVDTLRTPCCKANSWYHKACLQRMATCSGLHFFKCPLCNNKEVFQKEMLEFGIYIPDRDAEWELEPNAFQELLERHNKCDVPDCRCPRGRSYNKADTGWEIVLCDWCGHQGVHVRCGRLPGPDDEWVCEECITISNNATSPILKSKLPAKKSSKSTKSKKVTAGGAASSSRGVKRKHSVSDNTLTENKKHKLSVSECSFSAGVQYEAVSPCSQGKSKENRGEKRLSLKKTSGKSPRPLHSKKTHDKAKIKTSLFKQQISQDQKQRDLSFYFLGAAQNPPNAGKNVSPKPKTTYTPVSAHTAKAVRSLDEWLKSRPIKSPPRPTVPLIGLAGSSRQEQPIQEKEKTKVNETPVRRQTIDSLESSKSSESRADRARRRGSNIALKPSDDMPRWLVNHLKEDLFTGSNLGVKFLSLAQPCAVVAPGPSRSSLPGDIRSNNAHPETMTSRRSRTRTGSDIGLASVNHEGRPFWFRNLLEDDYITGRNLGKKLSAVSPRIQLSPGLACRLQTTCISPPDGAVPSGRGNESSSFPGDHPGAVTLGHGSTVNTQQGASASNTDDESMAAQRKGPSRPKYHQSQSMSQVAADLFAVASTSSQGFPTSQNDPSTSSFRMTDAPADKEGISITDRIAPPPKRETMKYWDFIQHLESIGYKHQSTIIDRLSLYQQYLEGDFELLTFADIKVNAVPSNRPVPPSPEPNLVSNDIDDDSDECVLLLSSPERSNPSSPRNAPESQKMFTVKQEFPNSSEPCRMDNTQQIEVDKVQTNPVPMVPTHEGSMAKNLTCVGVKPTFVDNSNNISQRTETAEALPPVQKVVENVLQTDIHALQQDTATTEKRNPGIYTLDDILGDSKQQTTISQRTEAAPSLSSASKLDNVLQAVTGALRGEGNTSKGKYPMSYTLEDMLESSKRSEISLSSQVAQPVTTSSAGAYQRQESEVTLKDLSQKPMFGNETNKTQEHCDNLNIESSSTTFSKTQASDSGELRSLLNRTPGIPKAGFDTQASDSVELRALLKGTPGIPRADFDKSVSNTVQTEANPNTALVRSECRTENNTTCSSDNLPKEQIPVSVRIATPESVHGQHSSSTGLNPKAATSTTHITLDTVDVSGPPQSPNECQEPTLRTSLVTTREHPFTDEETDTAFEEEYSEFEDVSLDKNTKSSNMPKNKVSEPPQTLQNTPAPVIDLSSEPSIQQSKSSNVEIEETHPSTHFSPKTSDKPNPSVAPASQVVHSGENTISQTKEVSLPKPHLEPQSGHTIQSGSKSVENPPLQDGDEIMIVDSDSEPTAAPSGAVLEIKEIPTRSPSKPKPEKKLPAVKVEEIATVQPEKGLIDLTSEDTDDIVVEPVMPKKRPKCCSTCGKLKRVQKPLRNLDSNTFISKDLQVIEID